MVVVQRCSAWPWKGGSTSRRCRGARRRAGPGSSCGPTNGSRNAAAVPALQHVGRGRVGALDLLRVTREHHRRVRPRRAERERLAVALPGRARKRVGPHDPLDVWSAAGSLGPGGRPSRMRQYEHEAGARRLAGRRAPSCELELAVHAARELGADRQAEAEPGRLRVLAALEALEDHLALLGRDARRRRRARAPDVAVDRSARTSIGAWGA